jgi:RNA polymerase sigma factor (sigma-70 family)
MTATELALKNDPLARWAVGKFLRRCPEKDPDALQAARLALWRAAKVFDASRGLKFSTFATVSIVRELRSHAKREGRRGFKGVRAKNEYAPVEAPASLDGELARLIAGRSPDPSATLERSDALAAVWEAAARVLDRPSFMALRMRFAGGLDGGEIARRLGCSRQWVMTLEQRALTKLREEVA